MSRFPISIKRHPERGFLLTTELTIQRPIEEVFQFFSSAENLERITPSSVKFKIITPTPIEMKQGALIDYRLKIRGIPIKWRTEIESWNPPFRFTDQQLRGPYKRWFHEHTFESIGHGATLAKDCVHYIPRFGSLVHKYFVKPDLIKIFTYRQETLSAIFANSAKPAIEMPVASAVVAF